MILIEVVENVLKPAVVAKNFSPGSPEYGLLISGYQSTPQDLANFKVDDLDAEKLRLALFFCSPVIDTKQALNHLNYYCDAYDRLRTTLNSQYLQALTSGFFEVLGELSSGYETFAEFIEICNIVKIIKYSGVDVSPLLDAMYTHYSSMCMTAITEISENWENIQKMKELIYAEIKAKEIGLSNENTISRVADVGLDFVENQIEYLNSAARECGLNKNTQPSQHILGLINKLGELPEVYKQRFELFRGLIGILEEDQEERKLNPAQEELPSPTFSNSIPKIQSEEGNSIYGYEHTNFHVEVKRGRWNNKNIVIKRYSKIKTSDWNPDIFTKEIQIMQKCSVLAQDGYPFLLCYGVHLTKDLLTILLESVEMDLGKKIDLYKMNNQKFTIEEIKRIVERLVGGFSLLEQSGIKHQDIKPQNILIGGSGNNIDVKIIDFSVSEFKLTGMATTHTAQAVTSAYYRAPELVGQVQTNYNAFKTDVYSLGIVFYQLYNVKLDIKNINDPSNQSKLLMDVDSINPPWLKNLLSKMFLGSSNRPTFRGLYQYLPGMVT